ncbi:hypothetical protein [Lachnoclostridium phytofermentans]|uniref:Alcohol acetyltransferase n=1 Tax=Lachnoclostridium phytofermentans (strain ATCC 700394 / DSM 18823 / ISDg) TaxID=357809 RepID=A9KN94_LACP7|nr:hypothetical protein [Lachnoclostridium phytofermentans]ABX41593.1 conserved hypothetical protein [Lachnoclostridium phytofermentans ISDg]
MKRNNYWYPVDNAGKIFPAVSKDSRSSVFRLSFYLTQNIQPTVLEQAVNEVLPRFETFAVELKSGLFWNYLSPNKHRFRVKPEPSIMCKYVPASKNYGYLFNVYYYENKITLETFHSLSDGTGSMEFLKSITYRYCCLCGYQMEHEGIIRSNIPFSSKETQDMFCNEYDKSKKKNLKEEPAYRLKGERFADHFSLCIRAQVDTEQLLTLTRSLNVTIGEYVTALLAYSIYTQNVDCRKSKKPIKLFVPVNLRKYFPSNTLRNFSLYIKATFDPRLDWTFESMLLETKRQFLVQLNKEDLHGRINSNVWIEKSFFIKILPLALKNLGFKLGYYYLAENISTYAISNLGSVSLPEDMKAIVKDVEFSIGGTNMAISSIYGHTNIMLNTEWKDLAFISHFMKFLVDSGLEVNIDTNYREGLDEIL